MASHSEHNNVDVDGATVAAVPEHNKRVSFGGEEQVQMIVYDDGVNDDYSISHNNRLQNQTAVRHSYTEPDAPPSRVRVHAEQAEIPRPISPPAQIAPVPVDAVATPSSASASTAAAVNHPSTAAQMVQMVNSPPLPSFIRRAEHDAENPFRPDEQLYHEVDPIVEMYRQRPFPPSPSHGSPVPPHQQTPSRQSAQSSSAAQTPSRVANGGGGGRHSSLAEARREAQQADIDHQQQPLMDHSADGLGPPGKAEMVQLPEKKKRACCSLQ